MKKTLLQKYIHRKLEDYAEPQRKGTPKGDIIGLSKQKYEASLLMLTEMNHKEIADKVGISHGLMRLWNTEALFKERVKTNHLDYVLEVIDYLLDKAKMAIQLQKNSMSQDSAGVDDAMQSVFALDELRDCRSYNTTLRMMLLSTLEKVAPSALKDGLLVFPAITLRAVSILAGPAEKNAELQKYRSAFIRLHQTQIIEGVIEVLQKPSLTEDDKRTAIYSLRFLEEFWGREINNCLLP